MIGQFDTLTFDNIAQAMAMCIENDGFRVGLFLKAQYINDVRALIRDIAVLLEPIVIEFCGNGLYIELQNHSVIAYVPSETCIRGQKFHMVLSNKYVLYTGRAGGYVMCPEERWILDQIHSYNYINWSTLVRNSILPEDTWDNRRRILENHQNNDMLAPLPSPLLLMRGVDF